MNHQCVAYVTDENYFFPTAVSASQARSMASGATDVVIVMTEVFRLRSAAEEYCREKNILLIDGSEFLAQKFSLIDKGEFCGRVSVSAMGRLLLSDLLPGNYQQVIYIDGDTQVVDSLLPLEIVDVPPGKIVAALDFVSIVGTAGGKAGERYFNSGVLKFNRADWIGPAAFDHFATHGGHLHDQGALNAVSGDALILMPCRWNFPKQFLHLAEEKPAIIHFMAHPKPWDGVFFPCTRAETAVYSKALQLNAGLRPFRKKISLRRWGLYKLRSFRDHLFYRARLFGLAPLHAELKRVLGDRKRNGPFDECSRQSITSAYLAGVPGK